jgi:hypothetical protein
MARGGAEMEERAEVMTDNQWDALVSAMIKIARRCKTAEEVVKELRGLLIKKKFEDDEEKPGD